jgi:hypothetical protein
MERSGMRGFVAPIIPDSATLHPGYWLNAVRERGENEVVGAVSNRDRCRKLLKVAVKKLLPRQGA